MPNFFFISGACVVISFGRSVFVFLFLFLRFFTTGLLFLCLRSERAILAIYLQLIKRQKYI